MNDRREEGGKRERERESRGRERAVKEDARRLISAAVKRENRAVCPTDGRREKEKEGGWFEKDGGVGVSEKVSVRKGGRRVALLLLHVASAGGGRRVASIGHEHRTSGDAARVEEAPETLEAGQSSVGVDQIGRGPEALGGGGGARPDRVENIRCVDGFAPHADLSTENKLSRE